MHTNNLQFIWLCALCEAKSQKISHSIAKLTKWQERARIPENRRRYCGPWLSSVCLYGNERIQHRGRCVTLHRCIRPRTNQEHHCRREHLTSLPGFLVHLFCPSQFFSYFIQCQSPTASLICFSEILQSCPVFEKRTQPGGAQLSVLYYILCVLWIQES